MYGLCISIFTTVNDPHTADGVRSDNVLRRLLVFVLISLAFDFSV